jgi:ligand-binding SRPBCC domain-containing protein
MLTSDLLFNELKQDYYPITKIKHLHQFINDNSRTIIIDCVDYKNIDKIFDLKVIESINAVFFIGCTQIKSNVLNKDYIKKYVFNLK